MPVMPETKDGLDLTGMRRLARTLAATVGIGLCLTTGTACAAERSAPPAELRIDSGPLRGTDQDNMRAYLGIPYAAPPVGNLRWKPPQRPRPWTTTLDATKYGNYCPQNADLGVFGRPGGAEDCLNLNVFVSKKASQSKKKLPVLVWIHGGSMWVGANRDYDARKLAMDGETVVVTINYRLGLLGYFAHPSLDGEGHPFANYGLMDQQLALDWVQRNISAFGGDPGDVTVAGESSGGANVLAHVVSPQSAGKFQHAIAMSGAVIATKFPAFAAPRPLDFAERKGTDFAKAAGCENGGAECLRNLPLDKVLALQTPYLHKQVIIDGNIIPMQPSESLKSGKFNRVTLIDGNTRDEGSFFAAFPENVSGAPLTAEDYPRRLETLIGSPALTQQALKEYPLDEYSNPSEAFSAALTDMAFACPGRAINRWVFDKTPTYAYEFADRTAPSYLEPTTFAMGAAHTFELAYLFPGFHGGAGEPVELNRLQAKLSAKMVNYWSTAGLAAEREAEWPRYTPEQDDYMSLTLPEPRMTSKSFDDVHDCGFWDKTGIY
ncbi:carboxylesterase/lipase family protein [Planotetraspora mira]|nr:carboxylesterase family protein [Planotetraspora mira]